jgi:large conductance mechanosensitive channel
MGFVKEFKEFAMKGNVMDMAVGVIIGGAFGKIVTSLVNDVLMPVISLCTGGVDFTNLFVKLSGDGDFKTLAEAQEAGASVMAYGQFIQNIVDFLIVAFCIFLMIKAMNKLTKKKEEEPAPAPEPPAPSKEEVLLTEIRDLLKQK